MGEPLLDQIVPPRRVRLQKSFLPRIFVRYVKRKAPPNMGKYNVVADAATSGGILNALGRDLAGRPDRDAEPHSYQD